MIRLAVTITLKDGVLDPQGKASQTALSHLGFKGVGDVRQGKYIELSIDTDNEEEAKAQADAMCQKLLANTVIEDYRLQVL
jgi:phosphoribosylformylglycinamidine synthase